jgi:hypothetical protein
MRLVRQSARHHQCSRGRLDRQFSLRLQPVVELVAGFAATRQGEVMHDEGDVISSVIAAWRRRRLRCAIGSRGDRMVGASSRCAAMLFTSPFSTGVRRLTNTNANHCHPVRGITR